GVEAPEVDAGGVQRAVAEEGLDRGDGGAAAGLADRPDVPEAVRVDALGDARLAGQARAERAGVAGQEAGAGEAAEPRGLLGAQASGRRWGRAAALRAAPAELAAALRQLALADGEPAVDGLDRVLGQRGDPFLAALAAAHADAVLVAVEIVGQERERLGDP